MKLLLVTREYPPNVLGGISYFLVPLINQLDKDSKLEIDVVSGRCIEANNAQIPAYRKSVKEINYYSINIHHVVYPIKLKLYLNSIDSSEYDLVYSHTPLPIDVDIPLVTHYHDATHMSRPFFRKELGVVKKTAESLREPTKNFVRGNSIAKTDHAIFNSLLTKNAWSDRYRESTPSSIVYNGVDIERFRPVGNSGNQDYYLFVGSEERKGIDAVRDFAKYSEQDVIVVGNPELDESALKVVYDLSQPELRKLYSGAIATLHPAHFEPFGNVVLESLACGTPVVVSEHCGSSEILTEESGVISSDLNEGVNKLERCDSERCRDVAKRYSWTKVANRIHSILSDVADLD